MAFAEGRISDIGSRRVLPFLVMPGVIGFSKSWKLQLLRLESCCVRFAAGGQLGGPKGIGPPAKFARWQEEHMAARCSPKAAVSPASGGVLGCARMWSGNTSAETGNLPM